MPFTNEIDPADAMRGALINHAGVSQVVVGWSRHQRHGTPLRVQREAVEYLTDETNGYRRRMVIEDALPVYAPMRKGEYYMTGVGFLVSELSHDELPPAFWRVISWHVARGWILIEQVTGHCGNMAPFSSVYHITIQ